VVASCCYTFLRETLYLHAMGINRKELQLAAFLFIWLDSFVQYSLAYFVYYDSIKTIIYRVIIKASEIKY
jgi:hypothetical protein